MSKFRVSSEVKSNALSFSSDIYLGEFGWGRRDLFSCGCNLAMA